MHALDGAVAPGWRWSRRQVLHAALAVWIALLAAPYALQVLEPEPPKICLVNLANNPRTASLFARGTLEAHGSTNTFAVVTPVDGCHPASERLLLVTRTQLMDWCLGKEICILTGDEECQAPGEGLPQLHEFLLHARLFQVVPETAAEGYLPAGPSLAQADDDDYFDEVFDAAADAFPIADASNHRSNNGDDGGGAAEGRESGSVAEVVGRSRSHSELQRLALVEGLNLLRPNVVLREYYSSKFAHPAVALGARFEFQPVSMRERDAGHRKFLFNFMGSIKVGQERDREHLRDVLDAHNWTMPIKLKMFDTLVRNPDKTTADEYRATLLSSSFTLAPVGTADDCFRFWEAIEAGSIPIYVRRKFNLGTNDTNCPDAFEDVLAAHPPIVLLGDWAELPAFAKAVTEAHIEDLRRNMVVWAKQWWEQTANVVDNAIASALHERDMSLAASGQVLAIRAQETSAALQAVKRQQKQLQEAAKAERAAARKKKRQEADARRKSIAEAKRQQERQQQKQKKQHPHTNDDDDDDDKSNSNTNGAPSLTGDDALSQRLKNAAAQRMDVASFEQGSGGAKLTAMILARVSAGISPAMQELVAGPKFNFIHDVVAQVLASTQYLPDFFSFDEINRHSVYMGYPVNRLTFLNKLVQVVSTDINMPMDYLNVEVIMEAEPAATRLFLCYCAQAALMATHEQQAPRTLQLLRAAPAAR